MKYTYAREGRVRKTVHRDAHAPEQLYIETVTDDAAVLERNKAIRSARLLERGAPGMLGEGDEMTAAFQFPSMTDYILAKKRFPEEFAQVERGGEDSVRAGEKLSILLPEYVTMVKRGDRL